MRRSPRDTCLGLFAGICLLACFLPSACFRLRHGQPPLSDEKVRGSSAIVKEGASAEDVLAALGTPHKREPNNGPEGGERWIYYTHSLEENCLIVIVGSDGRVVNWYRP